MAHQVPGLTLTAKSSGDMSSNQFKLVAYSSANDADGAVLQVTAGAVVHGVWLGNSTAATYDKLQANGVAKVLAGSTVAGSNAAISVGTRLAASTAATACPTTEADAHVFCVALEPLASESTGRVISALIQPGFTT